MNILQSLADQAKKKKDQLVHDIAAAPQAVGNAVAHIGAAPHPVNTAPAPVINAIQNAKYGVLAHNPAAQQNVIHQLHTPVAPRPSISTGLANLGEAQNQAVMKTIVQPFIARPAMEVAQTARQAITKRPSTYTPGSPMQRELFGNTPVASIQKKVGDQYQRQSTSSNPLLRLASRPLAAGEAAVSVANDIPVVGGLTKGLVKGTAKVAPELAKVAENVAPKAAPALRQIGQGAQKTAQTLDKGAVATGKAVNRQVQASHAKQGVAADYDATINNLTRQKAQLQQRIQKTTNFRGVETTQKHIDQIDQQIARTQAAKPKLTLKDRLLSPNIGLSMKAVHDPNLTPEQNTFIEQYAEMKKSLGQGNGVDLIPGADGGKVRVSNNYRDPGVGSGQLTNADWFDHAKAEIESGKGAYGASDEYRQLGQAPAEAPLDIPAGFDTIGQPTVPKATPQAAGTGEVSLPNGNRQRGFVTSVKASDEVSGKTKQMTTGTYSPRSTAKLQAGAEQVAGGDLNQATQDVHNALNQKIGTINDRNVADSIAVAKAHDAVGNSQQASDIYEKLAEHLTKQGQSIQAASLLSHQTPEGLQYGAQKALKKAGVELTPEVQGKLKTAIDEVRNATPGADRDYAVKKLQKLVSDHTPTGASDKLSSIWKAGLLTGVKTQTGNWLSNGTFQALHSASNPLAVGIDKAIGKFTGVRTKSLTNKGIVSGTGEGIQKAGKFLKTGIDERTAIDNKYDTHGELNFKNKALNTYVNGVFRLMGAADRPTYYSQLRNSLHDLALTDAANKGIAKEQLNNHVKQFLASPPTSAFQTATNEAEKAVLGNDTALSNIIGGVRQSVQRIDNPLARGTANAAVNFVAPFTKVPSAFLNRVIDFSPVGAVKEAGMQMAAGKLDQRQLATALSEATTGTAIVYLGYQAAKHNLLSGNYPSGDAKETQRWKADGIQPNSIKVGNKWLSLNYFGPLGLLFNAGQRVNDAKKEGQNTAGQGIAAVSGAPKDLMGQSFLQGLSGFTNAVNDPTRSAKTYINSQGSSIVPTIVGDVANATDKMQRQADTLGQTIQGKIPGVRQGLKPKQDVYGNPLAAKTGAANQLANPLRPSTDLSKGSTVLSEVNRLQAADPNNKDLQVTPTPVQKVVTIDKQKVNLTDKQRYDLQKQVGQTTQANWNKLIKTPEYQALDDAGKAKALSNLRTDSATLATRQYVTDNNLGTYAKGVSSKQANLANNGDISSYTQASSGNATVINKKIDPHSQKVLNEYNTLDAATRKSKAYKENDYDYKVAQAKYDNDRANGRLSKAQKANKETELRKAKVGSSYSKDVRELYGLSKSEVYDLLTTDENGKTYADQLKAYDQKLKDAGLISSLKYKNGFAPATAGSGGSKGSSKSLSTLLAEFKLPGTEDVKSRSKAASLARHAGLAKRRA